MQAGRRAGVRERAGAKVQTDCARALTGSTTLPRRNAPCMALAGVIEGSAEGAPAKPAALHAVAASTRARIASIVDLGGLSEPTRRVSARKSLGGRERKKAKEGSQ